MKSLAQYFCSLAICLCKGSQKHCVVTTDVVPTFAKRRHNGARPDHYRDLLWERSVRFPDREHVGIAQLPDKQHRDRSGSTVQTQIPLHLICLLEQWICASYFPRPVMRHCFASLYKSIIIRLTTADQLVLVRPLSNT